MYFGLSEKFKKIRQAYLSLDRFSGCTCYWNEWM